MKYIFIDTNNYIYSAISSQPEHEIESYEKLKSLIMKKEARLLVPEVVALEFETRVDDIYSNAKEYFKKLDESIKKSETPLLEGEKKKMLRMTKSILKEKDKKYVEMKGETKKLFYETKNIEIIELNSEILLNTFIRFLKQKMPFKLSKDEKLTGDRIFMRGFSDALIVESLRYFIKSIESSVLLLIFCSENIKDFALYDGKSDRHIIHPDIAEDITAKKMIYYRNIPEMLETEFEEILSDKAKKDMESAKEIVSASGIVEPTLSLPSVSLYGHHDIGENASATAISSPSTFEDYLRKKSLLDLAGESMAISFPSIVDEIARRKTLEDFSRLFGRNISTSADKSGEEDNG